jgi:HNH endonuclease
MSNPFSQGDVISYIEMCNAVGVNLQRGMNFRLRGQSIFLMSRRLGAPYDDQVDDTAGTLIYEGHDCSKSAEIPYPKQVDQPEFNPGGSLTPNGLFALAVQQYKELGAPPERVRVYEKLRDGIWVFNGVFDLIDCWPDYSTGRRVFKFKLQLTHSEVPATTNPSTTPDAEDDRIIPSWVKLDVWKRDEGKCRKCGAANGLHFDHIIPYSKGGSSKDPANIQILCGKHNLEKRDRIE